MMRQAIFSAILLLTSVASFAQECHFPPFAQAYSPSAYPAKLTNFKKIPPNLLTEQARLYRTRLLRAAKQQPNFAGKIRVTEWGCGTGCKEFALINQQTGDVWFPDFMVIAAPFEHPVLHGELDISYCIKSNLLVIAGTMGEREKSGIYYFLWADNALKLLRAIEN